VRFVVSDKTIAEDKVEVKMRTENDSKLISVGEALKNF